MGMVSGILPVVGVPLPFVSYGGTAMVTLGLGLGILMSVAKSRRLMQEADVRIAPPAAAQVPWLLNERGAATGANERRRCHRHRQHGPGHGAALARPRLVGWCARHRPAREAAAARMAPRCMPMRRHWPAPAGVDRRGGGCGADTRACCWAPTARRGAAAGCHACCCARRSRRRRRRAGRALSALGLDVVDAPMSGGPVRARDGTMSMMVACADAVFERCQGLLGDLSSRLFRSGSGRAMARAPSWSTTCWRR